MGGIALLRQGWQKLSNTCFNQFFAHSCSFFWQFSLVLLSPDFALSDIHLKPQGCYSGHMRHGTHSGHIWHTCHDYLLIVLWQPRDRSVTAAMGRVQQQSLHHHRHPSHHNRNTIKCLSCDETTISSVLSLCSSLQFRGQTVRVFRVVRMAETEQSSRLITFIFYYLAIGTLLPWNFFINVSDYWMYKFRTVRNSA